MTPEEQAKFIEGQLLAGKSYVAIGQQLGITKQAVQSFVKYHHIIERIRIWYYPDWLTGEQAAIKLGVNKPYLDDLIADGRLLGRRLGRLLLIDPEAHLPCLSCGQPRLKRRWYCKPCRKEAKRKVMWRRLYRKQGKPIPYYLQSTHKRVRLLSGNLA